MANFKLKKGFNLSLKGAVADKEITRAVAQRCGVVPDDFSGIIPRLDVKEGDKVSAGDALFHDKNHLEIKITSPVSGTIDKIVRGERRKIQSVEIIPDGTITKRKIATDDVKQAMLESGLWAFMRQRPYDIVPEPEIEPRDIFVTAFDSSPLAESFGLLLDDKKEYLQQGIDALATLTSGKVYVGFKPGEEISLKHCEVNTFEGPHPAGNAGVQVANVKPVNKGEVVWTLDAVTVARIGELLATGEMPVDTIVAVTGENVVKPKLVKCTMCCDIASLIAGNITDEENSRIISGNVLTGAKVEATGFLRYPYRQITVIPEVKDTAEFMGWASLSAKKFSLYRSFTSRLFGVKKPFSFDAKLNGGERAIIMSGEYDRMLPMDIYAEFLIKAIIAFDIDKMEQLGIYEVAPEDFALCEFADTSKLELQRIVREGLERLRKEMN